MNRGRIPSQEARQPDGRPKPTGPEPSGHRHHAPCPLPLPPTTPCRDERTAADAHEPHRPNAQLLAEGFRAAVGTAGAAAKPRPGADIARRIPGRRRDPDRLLAPSNGVTQLRQNDHYRLFLGGVARKASAEASLS